MARGARKRPEGWPITFVERGIMDGGIKTSGQREYHKYVRGEEISRPEAMRATCYACMNGFADGRQDCRVISCPLYPWQPYREE